MHRAVAEDLRSAVRYGAIVRVAVPDSLVSGSACAAQAIGMGPGFAHRSEKSPRCRTFRRDYSYFGDRLPPLFPYGQRAIFHRIRARNDGHHRVPAGVRAGEFGIARLDHNIWQDLLGGWKGVVAARASDVRVRVIDGETTATTTHRSRRTTRVARERSRR